MQLIVNPSCGFYVYWSMYFAFSQWFCALLLHAYKQCVVHVAVRKKFNVPNDIMHFVFGSDGTEFDDLGLMCSKQLLRQIMYDDVGKWGTAGGWHRYSGVSLLICKILYFEPEVHNCICHAISGLGWKMNMPGWPTGPGNIIHGCAHLCHVHYYFYSSVIIFMYTVVF